MNELKKADAMNTRDFRFGIWCGLAVVFGVLFVIGVLRGEPSFLMAIACVLEILAAIANRRLTNV